MSAFVGKGTVLKLATTPIADVVSISGPNATLATVDSTHLGSTSKEFLCGLVDFGSVSAQIEYDPAEATHATLTGLLTTPGDTPSAWVIEFPNDATIDFNGWLVGFNISGMENESIVVADIEIKISGAITIDDGVA